MHALYVTLNGSTLLNASIAECCSLGWNIACSRREQDFGHFMATGLVARSDGKCDFINWIEDVALKEGDDLTVQLVRGPGATTNFQRKTYEELESLRLEAMRAEAAGNTMRPVPLGLPYVDTVVGSPSPLPAAFLVKQKPPAHSMRHCAAVIGSTLGQTNGVFASGAAQRKGPSLASGAPSKVVFTSKLWPKS